MKAITNSVGSFWFDDEGIAAIERFCMIVLAHPLVLRPLRGMNEEMQAIYSSGGLMLLPTMRKTTVLYDGKTESFLKILHPLTFRQEVLYHLVNRARSVYELSECLLSQGLRVPPVTAFGRLKDGCRPFFIMKRVPGRSLDDLLVQEKRKIDEGCIARILDALAAFHRTGYWLRDLHLDHIFIEDASVSGFLEIDCIKRNVPFSLERLARDTAWLAHPSLNLSNETLTRLLNHYMEGAEIKRQKPFFGLWSNTVERKMRRWSVGAVS